MTEPDATAAQPAATTAATEPAPRAKAPRKPAVKRAARSPAPAPAAEPAAAPTEAATAPRKKASRRAPPAPPPAPSRKAARKRAPEAAAPARVALVRDSFTIPADEYAVLVALKRRVVEMGHEVKKTELVRAALMRLAALDADELLAAARAVPRLATGRPKHKGKSKAKG